MNKWIAIKIFILMTMYHYTMYKRSFFANNFIVSSDNRIGKTCLLITEHFCNF